MHACLSNILLCLHFFIRSFRTNGIQPTQSNKILQLSLLSISRTILLLPPPLLPSCPSTVTSCLGYCSCLRTGLPASVCDHLLNLFPPSSQRHLSTLLVRWHFSSVQTLPETASLLLSLSTRAPFPMSMLPPPLS